MKRGGQSVIMDNMYTNKLMEYGIAPIPENPVVAMAYIPFQNFGELYEPAQGIENGTMFPVLNKPFTGTCGGESYE